MPTLTHTTAFRLYTQFDVRQCSLGICLLLNFRRWKVENEDPFGLSSYILRAPVAACVCVCSTFHFPLPRLLSFIFLAYHFLLMTGSETRDACTWIWRHIYKRPLWVARKVWNNRCFNYLWLHQSMDSLRVWVYALLLFRFLSIQHIVILPHHTRSHAYMWSRVSSAYTQAHARTQKSDTLMNIWTRQPYHRHRRPIWTFEGTNKQTSKWTNKAHAHVALLQTLFLQTNPSVPDESSFLCWPIMTGRLCHDSFFVSKVQVNEKIGNLAAEWIIKLKCVCVCMHTRAYLYRTNNDTIQTFIFPFHGGVYLNSNQFNWHEIQIAIFVQSIFDVDDDYDGGGGGVCVRVCAALVYIVNWFLLHVFPTSQ